VLRRRVCCLGGHACARAGVGVWGCGCVKFSLCMCVYVCVQLNARGDVKASMDAFVCGRARLRVQGRCVVDCLSGGEHAAPPTTAAAVRDLCIVCPTLGRCRCATFWREARVG